MITIVSGFPRTGTSLMMRMLYEGGMEVFSDRQKTFFETKLVLEMPKYTDWLFQLPDCAVKILYPFIQFVPDITHRIIWMDRNLREQARSQRKIFKKIGEPVQKGYVGIASKVNKKIISDLVGSFRVPFIRVSFEDILRSPVTIADKINEFCGPLDVKKMSECVVKRSPKNFNGFLEEMYGPMKVNIVKDSRLF